MRTLGQDIRYSLRVLLRQPGFALAVITTLALGLGASSAIFAFVNGLLLRPMPYADADRLVMLESISRQGNKLSVNYLDYLDWRERSESFTSMAIHLSMSFNLATDREPVRVSGQMASADLLEVLGVEPEIGRGFLPEDDRPGAERVALISRSLWERYYEADPGLVGSEDGEVDPQLRQNFQGLQVHRRLREPHALRLPAEAVLEVSQAPVSLGVLVPAAGQGEDHVVVSLGQGRAVAGEFFLALLVRSQDGPVDLGGVLGHPGQEGGAEVEAHL